MNEYENNKLNSIPKTLACIFKCYRERHAVLITEDGMEINWPIKKFPENIIPGEKIHINLEGKDDQKQAVYEAQKKLLEELIN